MRNCPETVAPTFTLPLFLLGRKATHSYCLPGSVSKMENQQCRTLSVEHLTPNKAQLSSSSLFQTLLNLKFLKLVRCGTSHSKGVLCVTKPPNLITKSEQFNFWLSWVWTHTLSKFGGNRVMSNYTVALYEKIFAINLIPRRCLHWGHSLCWLMPNLWKQKRKLATQAWACCIRISFICWANWCLSVQLNQSHLRDQQSLRHKNERWSSTEVRKLSMGHRTIACPREQSWK